MFLNIFIFPILISLFGKDFEVKQISNSEVNVKNEVYTNTGEGGKSYSKSETIVNGERTVVESSQPGSIKVEIQQNDNASPTVIIEKSQDIKVTPPAGGQKKKVVTPKINKKTTPARFLLISNFWRLLTLQLKKIFKF